MLTGTDSLRHLEVDCDIEHQTFTEWRITLSATLIVEPGGRLEREVVGLLKALLENLEDA